MTENAIVGIAMGSGSDRDTMEQTSRTLAEFGVACEVRVISAHRQPSQCAEYARTAAERGLRVLIAGAGAAAALPGALAAHTTLPVIGVPIAATALNGMDALLAIVQMPAGVPVAAVAIGGAKNAAILAVEILALQDASLAAKLQDYKAGLAKGAKENE
jgi:phosphoribosylaminoimidazole carboxylase PurE protein